MYNGFNNAAEPETSNGLGSLADELAEALNEDEEDEAGEGFDESQHDGAAEAQCGNYIPGNCQIRRPTPILSPPSRERSLSPPKQLRRSKNHRRQNSHYDGSDYGTDSDLEGAEGISSSLEARMAAIEGLARQGTEANGIALDDVVQRVADYLRNLGSQIGVENGATRLITAHVALTTHLSHQTRAVSTLAYPLISPLSAPPDPELIDDLLPLLTSLILELPTPTSQPLSSLHGLHASTAELTSILTYLSDTLHVTRQTTSLASRRLRTATEMVVDLRREAEAREEAIRWVEKGNWDKRLAGRECARVCGDVVGGFEEVCAGMRERLIGGLEVGAA